MLTCHACMKRCLQTIIGESAVLTTSSAASFAASSRRYSRRSYATTAEGTRESRPLHSRNSNRNQPGTVAFAENKSNTGLAARPNRREEWLASRGVRPANNSSSNAKLDEDFVVRKHLTYLQDPLKLAEFVRRTLRDDDFETAEKVVRAASKNIQCTVSWNHLVDWQLSKGRMNAAIKTYNEMKKRAQFPDAHTYTIIFRGCAEHKDSDQALAKVLAMYHSMLTEKSPIKPNTIHMNAVLKMCARAQNMDALFTIAAQMPTKGVRAPNNLTFTTIINAQRIHAVNDLRSTLTPMQKRHNRQQAILDARRIWDDITKRWRQGDIWIDEELVCSMGRLLLVGENQDQDDILSLIEQSMNIPRQVPRKGSDVRKLIEPASQGKMASEEETPSHQQQPAAGEEHGVRSTEHFQVVAPPNPPKEGTSAYAKPGQNTLSLVLQALLNLSLKEPATRYWKIFTQDMRVRPDKENFHAYLRILRFFRASTETVELLLKMPLSDMEAKTFRIAMSTCDRDKKNRHAFSNAGNILDLMQMALKEPDIPALQTYLEVAISSPAYSHKDSSANEADRPKEALGAQILRALDRLNPSFFNLKSLLAFGDPTKPDKKSHEKDEFRASVLSLTQRMISAYDLLINKGLVTRDYYLQLTQQRSKLAAFVTRHKHRRQPVTLEPEVAKAYEAPEKPSKLVHQPALQTKRRTETAFSDKGNEEYLASDKMAEEERRAADVASRAIFAEDAEKGEKGYSRWNSLTRRM